VAIRPEIGRVGKRLPVARELHQGAAWSGGGGTKPKTNANKEASVFTGTLIAKSAQLNFRRQIFFRPVQDNP